MSERSILITGCSSGIGLCCARGMKARGWRVFATARKDQDIDRLAQEGLEAVRLDYSSPTTIETCASYVLWATSGKLTALFNNGAYGQPGAVEDISTDVLRAQFETNLFGWHHLTNYIVPAMRQNGGGRIVQCSSVLGFVATKYRGAYCASKFALEGLTDSLRLELKGSGVHVSIIEPGPIKSRFAEHAVEAFEKNVDIEGSVHNAEYEKRLAKLKNGGVSLFKREPDAVLRKLIHAVESKKPKVRYFVTIPTYSAAILKRILPRSVRDNILMRG